jgi:Cu-Zn family superoxide dismutase
MRIKRATVAAAILAAALTICLAAPAAAQPAQPAPPQPPTQANLKNQGGQDVGTVTLTQFPSGLLLRGELTGLPPGWHAIHVHETGRCDPTFEAAGGHLSAAEEGHGLDQPRHHAGDLPNIWVDSAGAARFEFTSTRLAVGTVQIAGAKSGSAATSGPTGAAAQETVQILDHDGAAIVVHERPDDYRSDPSGGSHGRIACGAVR